MNSYDLNLTTNITTQTPLSSIPDTSGQSVKSVSNFSKQKLEGHNKANLAISYS